MYHLSTSKACIKALKTLMVLHGNRHPCQLHANQKYSLCSRDVMRSVINFNGLCLLYDGFAPATNHRLTLLSKRRWV